MRRLFSAAFIAVLAFGTSAASAQPAQEDPRKRQAAPLFDEGRKLAEQGRNAESLEKFRKAYETYPSPNTQFNIARQEQLLGQRLAALRDYREALRNPVLLPQLATAAREAIADLEQSLARVKVVGPEGTRITVGDRVYTLPLDAPIDVDPGMTEVKGTHGTETLSVVVEAHAGTVELAELRGKSGPTPIETPPPVAPTHSNATRNIVSGALGAVGLVGVGLGFVFLAKAEGEIDDAVAYRRSVPGGACAVRTSATCVEYASMLDDVSSSRGVATGAFIGGGVFVAGAILTFVLWPKHSSTSGSLAPMLGPNTAGLQGTF